MNNNEEINYVLEVLFPLKQDNYEKWRKEIDVIVNEFPVLKRYVKSSGTGSRFYYFDNEDVARNVIKEIRRKDLSKGFSLLKIVKRYNDSIINSIKV
ncbi:MAG: hypothetical protein ACOC3Z_00700 [Nanoarchaeota archaeon]